MLKPGLYEQVINKEIKNEISSIPDELKDSKPIDKAEASGVLTSYISEIIKKCLFKTMEVLKWVY